jgi:nucleoside-diphosphate-sugar epimerase
MVTGNLGYIGTILTPMIQVAGHSVVGVDVDFYRNCTFGNAFTKMHTIYKDIRDIERADLNGIDAICHLAALSNDPLGDLNPELTFKINYKASVRLAELAKRASVKRFIFSSSCSNYGSAGDQMLTEESAFNPVTPYGKSKVLVEKEVSRLADEKFCPIFLRNATAYGLSPRLRFDLVVNNLVAWAFTTKKIMLKSDGSPWRPIVHVEDICRAFVVVLEAPAELVHNRAFNVGITKDNVQIKDIARIVNEIVPNCRVEFAKGACADTRCYRVNCDRLARVLPNFQPQWDIRRGTKELYKAYKKNGLTLNEFEGPRYQRIAQIRKLLNEGELDENLRYVCQASYK